MNSLKKKSLHAAVMAGLAALGAAGTADAVHISPDGLGQVLIFPYYTARAGHFTAISIINTQDNTKAVKVRFLEGKNSREVLDFNLFLSPADVWTGAVVQTANGARLISNDNSCVTPSDLFTETRVDTLGLPLNEFKNYQYTGAASDTNVFTTLDRTREGYFEVLEMGVIDDNATQGDAIAGATAVAVTGFIKHNSVGVPANCGALDSFDNFAANPATTRFPNTGTTPANSLMFPPRGGLTGRASIINSATGANYTLSPTAVDAWTALVRYSEAGNTTPTLAAGVNPSISNVFTSAGVVTATWNTGPEAMSGALMRNSVINEFILDAGTASQTDWVVTFPTKAAFVPAGLAGAPPAPSPFANNFQNTTSVGSCDPYGFSVFNREEGPVATAQSVFPNPSPIPPGAGPAAGATLCWEANVVPFGTSSLLGSTNSNPLIASLQAIVSGATTLPASRTTPSLRSTQGPNGWMSMNFVTATQGLTPVSATITPLGLAPVALAPGRHNGLPVVGAMLHNYTNTGVVSKYGGVVDHRFSRNIQ
ncbi:MAG: hypothetical protein ABI790_01030 [Betaproteobacteria bacterium]